MRLLFNYRLRALFLGDFILVLLATWYAPWIRGWRYEIFHLETGASILTILLYLLMLYIFDLYNIQRINLLVNTALRISTAIGVAGLLSVLFFYSLPQWRFGRSIFLIQIWLVWCCLILWRYLFRSIFFNQQSRENAVIIGSGRSGKEAYALLENPLSPYYVVGFLDDREQQEGDAPVKVLGSTDRLPELAASEGIRTAILAMGHERSAQLVRNLIRARFKHDVDIIEMPKIFEALTGSIPVELIDDYWLLSADGFNLFSRRHVWRLKYFSDLCLAIFFGILTTPLVALLWVMIRVDSPGPILFRQKRVGQKGRVFTLLKFRSMVEGAEENGPVWADEQDPRITRIGRFIRFLRLDELPQLINVLRGDMSLIGPRPERPEFVEELEAKIPYYAIRHSVRPGITGWAQVNFRYGASVEDGVRKLEYDLYYVKNMSFMLDVKIVLKTIGVVVFGEGAR